MPRLVVVIATAITSRRRHVPPLRCRPPLCHAEETELERPESTASTPSSSFSRSRSPLPSCPRRTSPEIADASAGTAVSPAVVPPSPFRRSRAVAALTTGPERSRRRGSLPSWPEPPQLATAHVTLLLETPRACRAPQIALPYPVVPNPHATELRPPPQALLRRAPTTPRSPTCSTGCAGAWASRRWSPPCDWSPEGDFRAPPPRLSSPAVHIDWV